MNAAMPPSVSGQCAALLSAYVADTRGIDAALLSTVDGRALATAGRIGFEPSRIAAISSSMLGLAEACARELGQPTCRHAIVDSGHGLAIVLRVASPGDDWVLTTIGDADASLGLLFSHSRQLAQRLAQASPSGAAPFHSITTNEDVAP